MKRAKRILAASAALVVAAAIWLPCVPRYLYGVCHPGPRADIGRGHSGRLATPSEAEINTQLRACRPQQIGAETGLL